MNHGKKIFFLFFLFFLLGFIVHAVFFPDLLLNRFISFDTELIGPQNKTVTPTPLFGSSTSVVLYENGRFHPSSAVLKKSNRLIIKNNSKDEPMWLESEAEFLQTSRPYGYSEALNIILPQAGTFSVKNKLDPENSLILTIKP